MSNSNEELAIILHDAYWGNRRSNGEPFDWMKDCTEPERENWRWAARAAAAVRYDALSGMSADNSDAYVCVRCNTEHLVSRDGPPYVYCHECRPHGNAPSPSLAAIVEAGDVLRNCIDPDKDPVRERHRDAIAAWDRARAALEGKESRDGK